MLLTEINSMEINSMENLQSDLSDATEFDNVDDPSPQLLRSGDSDSGTEI